MKNNRKELNFNNVFCEAGTTDAFFHLSGSFLTAHTPRFRCFESNEPLREPFPSKHRPYIRYEFWKLLIENNCHFRISVDCFGLRTHKEYDEIDTQTINLTCLLVTYNRTLRLSFSRDLLPGVIHLRYYVLRASHLQNVESTMDACLSREPTAQRWV